MIRAYTVIEEEFCVTNVVSQNELDDLSGKVEWLWVDCCDLDDKETMIMSRLLGVETKTLSEIQDGRVHPSYEKCLEESCPYYTWVSILLVEFMSELKMHPMSIILKDRFLITLRNGYSSRFVESVLRIFRTLRQEERRRSFIVSRLLYEIIDENSRAMVSIRELIDKIEGEAMEKPRKKAVTQSVFKLKKWLSTIHRLLWAEKELISDMELGIVPRVKLTKRAKALLHDAMDDINRELEFIDSYNRSLDSILRLQDLGLIHGVERTLVFLTVMLVVFTVVLVILSIVKV